MEHELWFTALLNGVLGVPVSAMLTALGFPPESPAHPIPNHVAMQILAALVIVILLTLVRSRLSVDKPGGLQQAFEMIVEGIAGQLDDIVGHGGKKFVGLLFTLAIFIFVCNVLGIIPGFATPTDQISVTAGCALVAFFYYNYWGARHHGILHYMKTFMGPIPLMAPLMIPIEIVSHLARVLSLSVRLYANMLAGHQVTLVFASLVPVLVPVVFEGLHIFVAALQAFIFILLTMIYLAGAVSEEH
jgi:F-type H+-transporting ATPase subunit a